jgi:hypothetical protein
MCGMLAPNATRPRRRPLTAVAGVTLALLLVAVPALAQDVRLRRVAVEADGSFEVLFTVLDGDHAVPLETLGLTPGQLTLSAGRTSDALAPMDLSAATVTGFATEELPYRVIVLLPNTDLFNGTVDDPARPDASGLRGAVADALASLPPRPDIELYLAVYDVDMDWLPSFDGTTTGSLRETLFSAEAVSSPGHFSEDPIRAADLGFSGYGRRASGNFVTYLVLVTSSLTVHESDLLGSESTRIRNMLEDPAVGHVVTQIIVYNPAFDDTMLQDPASAPVQFATQIAPSSGNARLVNTAEGVRQAFEQVVGEIQNAAVMRFRAPALEAGLEYVFQLAVEIPAGTRTSNQRYVIAP